MSHKSVDCVRLKKRTLEIRSVKELFEIKPEPKTLLLWFPAYRKDSDAETTQNSFEQIGKFCETTHEQTTICILTTPADAARLLPHLERSLRYKLWIAVKNKRCKNTS